MSNWRAAGLVLILALLAGCTAPAPPASAPPEEADIRRAAEMAARNFVTVVEDVAPVATQVCRQQRPTSNCDFVILVDDRPGQPPNAAQTVDRSGRPVIIFTVPLIADARNPDELAFILGHEAAHHIAGHIDRVKVNAQIGALVLGNIAAAYGYGPDAVDAAASIGAQVGARQYSKAFELEADALGAVIAEQAGYDAVRGAAYFSRIPDPGDQFLGSHPPNAVRQDVVREVVGR